jgi:hypothetical protein
MYRDSARESAAAAHNLSGHTSDASEAADFARIPGGSGRWRYAAQLLQRYL